MVRSTSYSMLLLPRLSPVRKITGLTLVLSWKRDAWRSLAGTKPMAAKEKYVNILLHVASEVSVEQLIKICWNSHFNPYRSFHQAFRKSGENENAKKILQVLGSMKPDEVSDHQPDDSEDQGTFNGRFISDYVRTRCY